MTRKQNRKSPTAKFNVMYTYYDSAAKRSVTVDSRNQIPNGVMAFPVYLHQTDGKYYSTGCEWIYNGIDIIERDETTFAVEIGLGVWEYFTSEDVVKDAIDSLSK